MINVGDLINDKYRVTRILGEGGMGVVVEAHHATLDMLVAIKFMRAEMVTQCGGPERFLREARSLVKLKSQHAVKVHDIGVHGTMPFIVMEHLEGTDLQTVLDKNGPMNAADAARQIRHACEAISEAHSLGIYHRDLKPANIFLARGASGRTIVKVLDFGIAKIMKPEGDNFAAKMSLTGPGMVMGTMHYMSPEQLISSKDVDGRSDIWSIGVVLYVLVTGELPFGTNPAQIPGAIRFEPPRPLALPPVLAPIIYKCLEKKKEDRYQSAVELAIALRPLIQESLSPFGAVGARLDPELAAMIGVPPRKSDPGDGLAPTVTPSALEFAPTERQPSVLPPSSPAARTLASAGDPVRAERVSHAHDAPTLLAVQGRAPAKSMPPEVKIETRSSKSDDTKMQKSNRVPLVVVAIVATAVVVGIVFFAFGR